MFATRRVAARETKKADGETMTLILDGNPTTVADPSATQTLTLAATTLVFDILMKRNGGMCEKLRAEMISVNKRRPWRSVLGSSVV
jgi:hypothetical protein